MKMTDLDKDVIKETVRFAEELVDLADICTSISDLRAMEREQRKKGPGGRPASLNDRAVLVLVLTLALLDRPLFFTHATHLLECLDDEVLSELGVTLGEWTTTALYFRVERAWNRLTSLIDPFPYPKRRLLTKEEWAKVEAERDQSACEQKRKVLDWLCNQLLEATFRWCLQQCPDGFEGWMHVYCIDATPVPTYGKRGINVRSVYVSMDPDAGWYSREGDHHADGKGKRGKTFWSYEATLAVLAGNNPDAKFPRIILGISFDRPGVDVSGHGRRIFGSILDRSHPIGTVVADRAYLPNSKVENLQIPLMQMGFDVCFDYQSNQLGISGNHVGAIQVEGSWFCPAMPMALIDATKDYRERRIDEETYLARIEQRRAYRLRPSARPDKDGYVPMMCPAAGVSATAVCPLKKPQRKNLTGLTRIMAPPAYPDKICTNQKSAIFPSTFGAKYAQKLLYGSPGWHKLYSHARNTIEGFNGYLKDADHGALHDGGRRRARGFTNQYLFTTLIVVAANIRKIKSFLQNKLQGTATPSRSRKPRRRDRLGNYWTHEEPSPKS